MNLTSINIIECSNKYISAKDCPYLLKHSLFISLFFDKEKYIGMCCGQS